MPELVPLLCGLIFASGAKGSSTSGLPADRAGGGSDFGTPASPGAVPGLAPVSSTVMPGLVPGIHAVRHRGANRERARRRRDVDARNKSGHDGWGKRMAGRCAPRPTSSPPIGTARAENPHLTAVDSFRAPTFLRRPRPGQDPPGLSGSRHGPGGSPTLRGAAADHPYTAHGRYGGHRNSGARQTGPGSRRRAEMGDGVGTQCR